MHFLFFPSFINALCSSSTCLLSQTHDSRIGKLVNIEARVLRALDDSTVMVSFSFSRRRKRDRVGKRSTNWQPF